MKKGKTDQEKKLLFTKEVKQIYTVVPGMMWRQCQHIQNMISQTDGQQSINRYEKDHTGMYFLASLMSWLGGM